MISEHDIEQELWVPLPIQGYSEIYEISSFGRIRRLVSAKYGPFKKGTFVGLNASPNGYVNVGLRLNGKRKWFAVHRLVLLAFVGEPKDGEEACHFDGTRSNNKLSNLRWDFHAGNAKDMVRHGRSYSGDDHWTAKSNHRPWGGDKHWSRMNPEKMKRGDEHPSRLRPETLPHGEKSPNHKLTNEGVLEIRRLYKSGTNQVQLAKIYGVNQTIISDVVRRVTWKHI